jgi:hypothetical protein
VARWLQEDLKEKRVIVGREVEIRPPQNRTDVLVKAYSEPSSRNVLDAGFQMLTEIAPGIGQIVLGFDRQHNVARTLFQKNGKLAPPAEQHLPQAYLMSGSSPIQSTNTEGTPHP